MLLTFDNCMNDNEKGLIDKTCQTLGTFLPQLIKFLQDRLNFFHIDLIFITSVKYFQRLLNFITFRKFHKFFIHTLLIL